MIDPFIRQHVEGLAIQIAKDALGAGDEALRQKIAGIDLPADLIGTDDVFAAATAAGHFAFQYALLLWSPIVRILTDDGATEDEIAELIAITTQTLNEFAGSDHA